MSQIYHYVMAMLGISMIIPVEKKARGGGGGAPTPPGAGSHTWPYFGF
jgi:hypothetical protein